MTEELEKVLEELRNLTNRFKILGDGVAGSLTEGYTVRSELGRGGPAGGETGGTGACCIEGVCFISTSEDCTAAGGMYQGNDTTCTPDPCFSGCPNDFTNIAVTISGVFSCGCLVREIPPDPPATSFIDTPTAIDGTYVLTPDGGISGLWTFEDPSLVVATSTGWDNPSCFGDPFGDPVDQHGIRLQFTCFDGVWQLFAQYLAPIYSKQAFHAAGVGISNGITVGSDNGCVVGTAVIIPMHSGTAQISW